MTEHLFTKKDRIIQLEELAAALRDFIPLIIKYRAKDPNFYRAQPILENALIIAEAFVKEGFSNESLTELSCNIPSLFGWHYRDLPIEFDSEGNIRKSWYDEMGVVYRRVVDAALMLRCTGNY